MAEMIPAQVHRDIEDIGKAVNTDAIITPRYGAPFKSLPMIAREFYADVLDLRTNKADKIDVDAALSTKAPQATTYTKIEVDNALSTKAPQSNTYTKSEVDTAFAAYVGGRKAYTTLALAQADQANLSINTAIEVTNDGANNGTYQWNGTTLTKSAYDPLTQAKGYADSNPLFRPSNNITFNYDLNDYTTGGIHIFNNAPLDPEVSKNFPAYGVGNGGTLFVMAVKTGDTSEVVRQVYVSRDSMYFRSRYQGVFESWIKVAKDIDLASLASDFNNSLAAPIFRLSNDIDLNTLTNASTYVFSNAPEEANGAVNFPAYGSGNAGTLLVLGAKSGVTNTVVRQVYITATEMYFRATTSGVFGLWNKVIKESDLTSSAVINPPVVTDATVDLDNYKTAGTFVFPSAVTDSIVFKNFPEYGSSGTGGTLFVLASKSNSNFVRQIFINRNSLYYRATFNGVFDSWSKSLKGSEIENGLANPVFRLANSIDLNTFTSANLITFSNAPTEANGAVNFPVYGSGNAGTLLVLGAKAGVTSSVSRQVYITTSNIYFRTTTGGVFNSWIPIVNFKDIAKVERDTTANNSWMYLDGKTLKQDRGVYPDYYTKTNVELWTGVDDWYARFDALMTAHPSLITKEEIGRSVQDRAIYAYTVNPPPKRQTYQWADKKPPKIIIQACLHGWEYVSSIALLGFLENMLDRFKYEDDYSTLRNTFQLVVIPIANPDGAQATTRENANGVDLNRDFVEQSQVETQALSAFYDEHFDAVHFIDLHAHGEPELFWLGTNDNYDFAVAFGNELVGDCQRRFLSSALNPDSQWLYIAPSIHEGTCLNYFTTRDMNAILLENLGGTGHVSGFTDSWITCRKIAIHSVLKLLNFMLKVYVNSSLKFPN